jgi:molecular chaperone GrpE
MSKEKMEKIEYVSEDDSEKAEDKVKKIKEQLKKAEQERAEYLAGWQRAKADLINYKKEQEAKISEIFKFANEGLIYEILPVLDSFELAMKHFENNHKDTEGLGKEEIKQIYNQFKNILKSSGVEEIQVAGEKFNPEFHESVGEIEGGEQGLNAEEIQKGYKLNGKVIRASKVKVGK